MMVKKMYCHTIKNQHSIIPDALVTYLSFYAITYKYSVYPFHLTPKRCSCSRVIHCTCSVKWKTMRCSDKNKRKCKKPAGFTVNADSHPCVSYLLIIIFTTNLNLFLQNTAFDLCSFFLLRTNRKYILYIN